MNDNEPTHDQISRHAEDLWRERGYPQGRDDEIWLEAEQKLKRREAAGNPRIPDVGEPSGQAGSSRSDSSARAKAKPMGDGKLVRDQTRD